MFVDDTKAVRFWYNSLIILWAELCVPFFVLHLATLILLLMLLSICSLLIIVESLTCTVGSRVGNNCELLNASFHRHCEERSNLIFDFETSSIFISADCFVVPPRNDEQRYAVQMCDATMMKSCSWFVHNYFPHNPINRIYPWFNIYSLLKLFAGLATAAFIACVHIVIKAITNANIPDTINTIQLISIR